MALKQVVPGLYQIGLGFVNAYLLDDVGKLTLVDTGVPGSETKILAALAELGKKPGDVKRILVTHAHGDHTGGLAALKQATNAPAYMHHADAELVRRGESGRPVTAAPGLFNGMMYRMMASRGPMAITPAEIEYEVGDGQELPMAGGLCAVAAPGHCLGQLTFFWPKNGGVLIAADAASNQFGRLGYPPIFEDMAEGVRSLERLGALDFQVAVFGHGGPLLAGAAEQFRRKWPRRA
jgi:glyoxylase-like metal-dependent hydrolase (beta-lactamase superfamily II)